MKVLYERVAGIDVHKDMIKVAIRSPGDKPWTRKTEILEYRTIYGVLQEMARQLRAQGEEIAAVPTTPSGTPCSPPSRRGLSTAEFVKPAERRPSLTASARGVTGQGQVGTKKRPPDRTKKLTRKGPQGTAPISA